MRERPHGRESRFNLWAELKRLVPLRRLRWKTLAMVLALFWAMSPGSAGLGAAQAERPTGAVTVAAPVPFGPGERAEYQVRLGRVSVGEGHLEVRALETVRGYRTYHVTMGISGGVPLARVNNHYQSWIDVSSLSSRRFIQSQHEVRYRRFRHFEFFPEERRWSRADVEESGELETDSPLDDLSFLFYARTLPLVVGESYTLDRYFRPDGNPVVIQVVRRDRVEVPAGTFNTIVVRPVIQTRGLFAEGGEAEIHFSDDERRVMVQLRSRVPVVGSLTLSLRSLTPGRPIHDS